MIVELDRNYQAIENFLLSGGASELTETQDKKYKRLITVHELLLDRKTDQQVKDMIMARFGSSESTAYRDIADAKKLFGVCNPIDPVHTTILLYHWNLQEYKKASTANKLKEAAAFLKNMKELTELAKELNIAKLPDVNINVNITAHAKDIGLEDYTEAEIETIMRDYNDRTKLPTGRQ